MLLQDLTCVVDIAAIEVLGVTINDTFCLARIGSLLQYARAGSVFPLDYAASSACLRTRSGRGPQPQAAFSRRSVIFAEWNRKLKVPKYHFLYFSKQQARLG